jgi:hypothetical protein
MSLFTVERERETNGYLGRDIARAQSHAELQVSDVLRPKIIDGFLRVFLDHRGM